VVDAVEEEMRCDGDAVVREVAVVLSVTCHPMKLNGNTHSSKWNKHLWSTYSIIVQKPSPKAQYPAKAVLFNCVDPKYAQYPTKGSHRVGTMNHAVLLKGSRKFPKSGAEGPPL
jgi:hypothetical protein